MSEVTAKKTILVLEDGSVYEGYAFGAETDSYGEVVFNTSMTGYQEMLTDPSYAGQIVVPTYPLIGNYGINQHDSESKKIQVRGFVVREECYQPNHYLSEVTLTDFLKKYKVPGIYGVDTRAITRKLRSAGVMMGIITSAQLRNDGFCKRGKHSHPLPLAVGTERSAGGQVPSGGAGLRLKV